MTNSHVMIGRAWLTLLAYYLVVFGNCSEVLFGWSFMMKWSKLEFSAITKEKGKGYLTWPVPL